MDNQRCTKCGEVKPLSEYYRDKTVKSGYKAHCKQCSYKPTKEQSLATRLRFKERHPDHIKERALLRYYNLTLDEFNAMLLEQGGVCKICGGLPSKGKSLHVDHNHETGVVRGLLCQRCNIGLGILENLAWKVLAEAYLKEEFDGNSP